MRWVRTEEKILFEEEWKWTLASGTFVQIHRYPSSDTWYGVIRYPGRCDTVGGWKSARSAKRAMTTMLRRGLDELMCRLNADVWELDHGQ